MKILMITPYLPYPLVSGGQIRTYNLLKNLSPKHEIVLASFIREDSERKLVGYLKKFCKDVIVFKRRKAWSAVNILLAAVTPYPFLVSLYFSPQVRRIIEKKLAEENFDLIHAETFYVMPNIPRTKIPVFLVEQTIEYQVYQKFVENLPWYLFFIKPLLFLDVYKIKVWEKHYWRKARRLAAMSEEDKRFIENINPGLKIDVVANGVDTEHFSKTKKDLNEVSDILFVGQFKWLPNRDAAKFLAYSIWPLIRFAYPGAKLWIVGRNPTDDILSLEKIEGVKVEGHIEDIRQAYSKADVLLAPIRNGRGTKYKILEAMATKTPIVGTPLAVEGIDIEHNKEALIGTTAEELANLTIEVLKNPSLGARLANSAYRLIETKYNWKVISDELDRVYKKVAYGQG